MKRFQLLLGATLTLTSVWAIAQDAPESLLPDSFTRPSPRPSPKAASPAQQPRAQAPGQPGPQNAAPRIEAEPRTQTLPTGGGESVLPATGDRPASRLPSLAELEAMSPDDLAEVLGLKPSGDIPPAARRAMNRVGVLDQAEGGLPPRLLAGQNAVLVRAALAGNKGALVSRWGHIMLRRALVSRLDAPAGLNPADFAALRAALLVRMGEGEAARALVQDVDTGNYTPALTDAALQAYVATADFTGACPVVALQGGARKEPEWDVLWAICDAFGGESAGALSRLDRALNRGTMPAIDLRLAQKYAGAAGKTRRAVKIEWDNVSDMTPWRYGLAIAVGLQPPPALMRGASPLYDYTAATAPMVGIAQRAAAADRAGAVGVLSSAAMVDLYSQIYEEEDITGDWSRRADSLRTAYVGDTAANRLAAIRELWDTADGPEQRYSRQVLTAYAAARLPAEEAFASDAAPLIASMLAAGLDSNALRWAGLADVGSEAWALLALAAPSRAGMVEKDALSRFRGYDKSASSRKTGFLLAGLAGLDRVSPQVARAFANDLGIDLARESHWSRLIAQSADVNNAALVMLLVGVGMQGESWDRMTPRHLYQIVAALKKVGLDAEARMIAAEAVARG
jgi:hypothetical protein